MYSWKLSSIQMHVVLQPDVKLKLLMNFKQKIFQIILVFLSQEFSFIPIIAYWYK